MTDAPTTDSPRIAAATAAVPPADPLARLHHMSTTAGITSQEYVAINLPSVFSTLLGLASLAVLVFHQWVLLVIPLAAIAFGVAALRQIRDSNGTQTGRAFAWVGIVLALLLGGGEVVAKVTEGRSERADQEQIAQLFRTLGERVSAKDNAAAYALFTDRFRTRVSREQFDNQWNVVQSGVSPISTIDWNGVKMYFERDGSGTTMGTAMAVFRFTNSPESVGRQPVVLRHEPSGWQIDDIPALFPQTRKPAR